MRIRSNFLVAALYLLPALGVLGGWYTLLFVPDGFTTPEYTFAYVLTEAPRRLWFRWLLIVPVLWALLAVAYITPIASRRAGAATLLGVGLLVAVGAWATLSSEIAIFASLPLVCGVLGVRDAYR